ncbi:MAG: twin-arginine translocation signal domain-containing protein, partial [Paraglaciecola sp.]|nr:twin-arginine translocation signal domain-containing protein [Paraglaciecola sp.]
MNRRDFMKMTGVGSIAASLPLSFKLHAVDEEFTGKFLVNL